MPAYSALVHKHQVVSYELKLVEQKSRLSKKVHPHTKSVVFADPVAEGGIRDNTH